MTGGEVAAIIAACAGLVSAFRSGQAKRKADVVSSQQDDVKEKVENGLAQAAGQNDIKEKIEDGKPPDTPGQH